MLDVLRGLVASQRLEVISAGDTLRQLPQVLPGKQVSQFGLADQDDLQQLLLRGLKIGQ